MAFLASSPSPSTVQEDRIGPLPDSVLIHILSFLPTLDAVRTSALSTRWRTLWTSVGVLDLDEEYNSNFSFSGTGGRAIRGTRTKSTISFAEFVGNVLSVHHTPTLLKLRLNCCSDQNFPLKNLVIRTAVSRGVQTLDLCLPPHPDHDGRARRLPSLLFTSQSLVELRLGLGGSALILPRTMALVGLRRLRLCSVRFCDDHSTRALFSSSTALRSLTLEDCDYEKLGCLEISCPSLQELAIHSSFEEDGLGSCLLKIAAPQLSSVVYRAPVAQAYVVEPLLCVEYVKIQIEDLEVWEGLNKPCIFDRASSFLSSLSSARNLELCPVCIEALQFRRAIDTLYPVPFRNLNVLRTIVEYLDYRALHVVMRLWLLNPQLRSLVVEVKNLPVLPPSAGKEYFLKLLGACFECGSGVLQRVEIRCSTTDDTTDESDSTCVRSREAISYTVDTVLELVRVLLGSQPYLKKLILSDRLFCEGYSTNSTQDAVIEKVLSFPKRTPELAVVFI